MGPLLGHTYGIVYMGPKWVLYGQTHMGLPGFSPYGTPIWAHTYGGVYMGPIWVLYGQTHMGLPGFSPYGAHICMFAGYVHACTVPEVLYPLPGFFIH